MESQRAEVRSYLAICAVAASLTISGCTGVVDGGLGGARNGGSGANGNDITGSSAGNSDKPNANEGTLNCDSQEVIAPQPLRRLSKFEYNNTILELLGDDSRLADAFASDGESHGFDNNAENQRVTRLLAEQYMSAAELLAAKVMKDPTLVLNCDPVQVGEDACAQAFITTFGRRAFRRPLQADEKTRLTSIYAAGKREQNFATGIRLVLETILQSAAFLYRVEIAPTAASGQANDWEMATRLSYLLWGNMPDEALFAAAAAARLSQPDDIAAQAVRMLADPRAHRMMKHFHNAWLGLDRLDHMVKDPKVYAAATPGLPALWRKETEGFVNEVLWKGDGRLSTLLTAPFTFANSELAQLYGIASKSSETLARIELDPVQRAGLLTQAGLLAASAKPNQTSPVHRGLFVRERLLCATMPSPPEGVEIKAPDLDPNLTTRERFNQHASDRSCAGCHRLMDPIGLGFEGYDGIGAWRSSENGKPIDARGELFDTDVDGRFTGAVELSKKLAESTDVRECVVRMWFRFGYGRTEGPEDVCTLQRLNNAFEGRGRRIQDLVLALTTTDFFRFRSPSTGGSE